MTLHPDPVSRRLRVACVAILALAVAGCGSATGGGGGWLTGRLGGRATLGFDGACVDGVATGSLSYIDRSVTPTVSFVLTSGTCSGDATDPTLAGTYRARPRGGSGQVTITFHDGGATGPNKGDTIAVTIVGGAFDGYTHAGPLRGGNISFTMDAPTPTPTATPG